MKNLKRTWKNKIYSCLLLLVGYLSTLIDGDATAFVFIATIAVPLFFSKENYIL